MRQMLTLLGAAALFTSLALADSWSGKLIDATCLDAQKTTAVCQATGATTAFALEVENKVFRLDTSGNAKAAEALKNRADRQTDPASSKPMPVVAKISGTKDGEMLKVETVEVQ